MAKLNKVFVVEDDLAWLNYYQSILTDFEVEYFKDGVSAINGMNEELPGVVMLDILLTGPTGLALLNEMQSYTDLAEIPILIVSNTMLSAEKDKNLKKYGIVRVFNKATMYPQDLILELSKWT